MKNLLKIGVLAAAIMFSMSSCSSCKNKNTNAEGVAIDTSDKTIGTAKKTIDTTKKQAQTRQKKILSKNRTNFNTCYSLGWFHSRGCPFLPAKCIFCQAYK